MTHLRYIFLLSPQSPQADITWNQCADLPTTITSQGTAIAVNGNVYYGAEDSIFCYNPTQDDWIELQETPVTRFGLGHMEGRLVIAGGHLRGTLFSHSTNKVYTQDGLPKSKWKQTLPVMPTARSYPGVLSTESALIVAGGLKGDTSCDHVEIFKQETLQWYIASALPSPCFGMPMVLQRDICYAVGGRTLKHSMIKNNTLISTDQTFCASIDELLSNSSPVWKTLANTPSYAPAVAMLGGSLVATGGDNKPVDGTVQNEMYIYSTCANSWINTFDLPLPLPELSIVAVSSTEIMVIGGPSIAYVGTVRFNL